MHKCETPNGRPSSFREWGKLKKMKGRRNGHAKSCGKSLHQIHWGSVRNVTRTWLKSEGWRE